MAWKELLSKQGEFTMTQEPIGGHKEFESTYSLYAASGKVPEVLLVHSSAWNWWHRNYATTPSDNSVMGIPIKIDDTQPTQTSWFDVFAASQPAPLTKNKVPSPFTQVKASNIFQSLLEAWKSGTTLPTDSAARKLIPIHTGFNEYFPAAIAAVAAQSFYNNKKHNPDGPLAWPQDKSMDQSDCYMRHLLDQGDAKVSKEELAEFIELTSQCWRKLAELQLFAQKHGAPKPPAAK